MLSQDERNFPIAVAATCAIVFRSDAPGVPMPQLVGTQVVYHLNRVVTINGGDGFDKTVAIATEFADHLVITASGVFGAGLSAGYTDVEALSADVAEHKTYDVRASERV